MIDSLYAKLALVLTGLFCLVGMTVIGVALFSTEMYHQELTQRLNRDLAGHIVGQKLLISENKVNREATEEIFQMLMVINPSIEIYLLDPRGKILTYSAAPGKVKRETVDLAPLRYWLEATGGKAILGDDPRSLEEKKVFSAARIPTQGELQGYLYVILGGEIHDSLVQKLKGSYILKLSLWTILAGLLFALTAGLVLFATLTRRLRKLTRRMAAFGREKAMLPVEAGGKARVPRADEFEQMNHTFRAMAARIDDQIDQLQRSDALRRELVANVSHDLRTPLATLRGYIETLQLKDARLTPEQRREYLDTALLHCDRLGKLVQDLFELAKLDSDDMRLEKEPFHLSELVHDVVQKFQLQAQEKQIRLATTIQGNLPFVEADIGLIERVLENLLENALHYTPAGGEVELALTPRSAGVQVEVRDSGPGIPEDRQTQIFDRFYRLDPSRGSSAGHSGLGLAISKRILELHNRTIRVAGTLNRGTVFSFTLPPHSPA